MTAHKIFDGAFVMYSDMHLKECTSYFQSSTDSSLLYIDHCREGRIESEIGNHAYSYLQENEMRVDDRRSHSGRVCFPLCHYHGMTLGFDLDIAVPALKDFFGGFSVDLYELQKKYCNDKKPFVIHNEPGIEHIFSELIAGPILKYHQVERYLQDRRTDLDAISYGVKRFVTGLAKKVLLANNLGLLWKQVTELGNEQMSILMAWLGIAAFALQIYFDFSGYSDMAIGLGAVLGFHFPENFNYPYIAASVKDFWHRWHISLSTWFKEYVYIPLGGNRKGLPRQLFNILVVWMLTGIWHGAGWNFLFWGLWFAFFLILEKLFLGDILESVPKVFGRIYTLAVVLISWVFFALESPGEILAYLQAMFGMNGIGPVNSLAMFLCNEYLVLLVIALVACLPLGSRLVHALKSSKTGPAMALYRLGEKVIPAVLLLLSVAYIVDASYNPFLYFRF